MNKLAQNCSADVQSTAEYHVAAIVNVSSSISICQVLSTETCRVLTLYKYDVWLLNNETAYTAADLEH
jgi:hypothetical protein